MTGKLTKQKRKAAEGSGPAKAGKAKARNTRGPKQSPQPVNDIPFVIGIGASAGGLEALRTFLSHLEARFGGVIVVVQHMAPKYRSMLAELLSRESQIKVEEVVHGVRPKLDTLYVTPPNHDLVIRNGELHLVDAPDRIGPKPSVDRFFSCLADELGENCGGIVLSGTGSDGAQGVRAIKAAGGFVIAQDPESAKYDGMPRAAINTGVVDLVLTPTEIATQLSSIISHLRDHEPPEPLTYSEEPFKAILELLKRHTKVDFLQYKPNTLRRRLQRRLKANRLGSVEQYFDLLQKDDAEVKRLFQDVLISVTAFFRDGEQYESLKQCLRTYLLERKDSSQLRIWSAGCSTGEEAYSVAIIVSELFRDLKLSNDVQIFATDINDEAMTVARRGVYSATSLEEMPRELIERYFERFDAGFQVKKTIRERVVFARHDLTRDPPFLKMDLICCRNVFIYFDQPLQDKIIKIFHYALKPRGVLFLGKSESAGSSRSFFITIDSNTKIFQRNERPSDPSISFSSLQIERGEAKAKADWPRAKDTADQLSAMVRSFAPNAIVVDEDFGVREVYGGAKRYLDFPEGSQTLSIEKLLNATVKNKVITLLHRAKRSGEIAVGMHFDFVKEGARDVIQPRVYPVKVNHEPRLVLSFETVAIPADVKKADATRNKTMARELEQLERELAATREHLQTVIQEQETSNEELQALNEELHSANEELQSTNEELETSNEELQSTNEELTTLNEELNVKSAELMDLNNYLATIQDAIQYPIIVVDRNLNLVRFNRGAERSFRLLQFHRGKNVRLVANDEALDLAFDSIEEAFKSEEHRSAQIKTKEHDYEVKCDPIFNHKDEIDGIVVSFVDNTQLLKILRAIEGSEKNLKAIFENIPAAVSIKNTVGIYTYANRHFCNLVGVAKEQIVGAADNSVLPESAARGIREKDLEVLANRLSQLNEEVWPIHGQKVALLISRFPLLNPEGAVESVCSVSFDVTETRRARDRLELFKETIMASRQGVLIFEQQDDGSYPVTFASQSVEGLLGIPISTVLGTKFQVAIHKLFDHSIEIDGEAALKDTLTQSGATIEGQRFYEGKIHCYEARSTAYYPPGAMAPTQVSLIIFDITERKEAEELLRKKQDEVMKAAKLASLGEMAAGIAHELNTPLSTIQSYVDFIKGGPVAKSFDEETRTALDKIEATITRISEIIVGLKTFSKIDKNNLPAEFNLVELTYEVLRICDFHLRNKGVKAKVESPRSAVYVRARRTQICQVLVNLVNNAIDAVRSLREKWIKICLYEENGAVTIQVIDSGTGIPEKIAAMVMTPFFTTKDEGTGLGLSLSRSIIKAHGGDLRINVAMPNTCFEVVLPREGGDGTAGGAAI